MKINILVLVLTISVLQSCKDDKQKSTNSVAKSEKVVPNECYISVYENDTLRLELNTVKPENVTGNMEMKIAGRPAKNGTVAGKFSGDTLFVHYTFTEGENKDLVFKNPLALLKKENQLILGNGKIETTMGASYFIKGEPIDFERVKYRFMPADCK